MLGSYSTFLFLFDRIFRVEDEVFGTMSLKRLSIQRLKPLSSIQGCGQGDFRAVAKRVSFCYAVALAISFCEAETRDQGKCMRNLYYNRVHQI